MPYIPSAASLAAAHKGKIKNIRSTVLRDMKEEKNPGIVILKFESEALTYDDEQKKIGSTGN